MSRARAGRLAVGVAYHSPYLTSCSSDPSSVVSRQSSDVTHPNMLHGMDPMPHAACPRARPLRARERVSAAARFVSRGAGHGAPLRASPLAPWAWLAPLPLAGVGRARPARATGSASGIPQASMLGGRVTVQRGVGYTGPRTTKNNQHIIKSNRTQVTSLNEGRQVGNTITKTNTQQRRANTPRN